MSDNGRFPLSYNVKIVSDKVPYWLMRAENFFQDFIATENARRAQARRMAVLDIYGAFFNVTGEEVFVRSSRK